MTTLGEYTVKARFQADIKAWTAGLKDAANATDDFAMATEQAAARATKAQQSSGKATRAAAKEQREAARAAAKAQHEGALALQQTADVAAKAAIAVGAGMGLAAKAAIDWESAWAGVTKSVDGATPKMEAALRGLAKTMPATHDEIAAVAEAAGQLDVASGDIVGFTETMIQLGETTNLTADEAATSIAQISNVMGTMDRGGVDAVRRFGAALVHLGNNGASTERDILSMASRIAGAAKVVGMSEADLLAVSNALSSVGIEAEAGGTAFSNVLIDMSKAVKTGSADLDRFAQVAGMSSAEFSSAFQERPAAAIDAFVQGLGRIQASGGDVFTTLSDLGQADVRVSTALLKMAGAGDLLTQSLRDGEQALSASSALSLEYAKRLDTTGAKLGIARNNIRDAAISIGDAMTPAVAAIADGTSKIAQGLGAIPAPARNAGLAVAGLASGGVLAAAGVAKVVDVAKTAGEAFTYISTRAPRAGAAMTKAAAAARGFGIAMAAAAASGAAIDTLVPESTDFRFESVTKQLLSGADAIGVWDQAIAGMQKDTWITAGENVNSLGRALDLAFNPTKTDKFTHGLESTFSALTLGLADIDSPIDKAKQALSNIDQQLASLVSSGNAVMAGKLFEQLKTYAADYGVSAEQLGTVLPAYGEALAKVSNDAAMAGDASKDAAGGVDAMGASAEDAAAAVEDLQSSIEDLGSTLLAQRDSARGYEAALDDAAAAAKENGRTLDITTEAGRANEAALDGIAEATKRWAADSLAAGDSASEVAGIIERGREAYIAQAVAMGKSGAEAAALADSLGLIPEHVRSDFEAAGLDDARTRTEGYIEVINGVPTLSSTRFETPGSTESQGQAATTKRMLDEIPKSSVTHFSTPGSKDAQWQSGLVKGGIVAIPKSWSSHLSVSGAAAASAAAWQVKNSLESIPRTVWSSVIVSKISRNVPVNADGGIWQDGVQTFAKGGIALATGAYVPRVSQIASGTGGILWQEPETGWETYISGKPSQRRRNLGIWAETGRRLGIDEELLRAARVRHAFADGGGVRMPPNTSGPVAPTDPSAFGAAVGAHVQAALHGAQVVMDGARVGRLVTRHQSGMTRV